MAKPFKVKKVSPEDEAAAAAVRILRLRLREFYSHWRNPDQVPTPAQLHDLRISGKRLRYSADSLRDLYPDRLTALIDLLKRLQDLLGEMQDCETQRPVIEADLARLNRRAPRQEEIAALQQLIAHYQERREKLFKEVAALWHGIASKKFRASLKDMVSHPTAPARDGH
jgi:CHAD domain-containing protein